MMIAILSFDLTPFQWAMVVCAVITAAIIFALLRHVPKTPQTRRLQSIAVAIAFVVIIATVLEKLGWIH
jgi:bacteriorhodopsin